MRHSKRLFDVPLAPLLHVILKLEKAIVSSGLTEEGKALIKKRREESAKHAQKIRQEQQALVAELKQIGISVRDVWDLVNMD